MFKKFLPKSLFGRFLMIILVPSILVQMIAIYIFYERHWSGVSRHMAISLAGEILFIEDYLNNNPYEKWDRFLQKAQKNMYLNINFKSNAQTSYLKDYNKTDFAVLNNALADKLENTYRIYYIDKNDNVAVDIQFTEGVLQIIASKKRLANPSTYIFILWMTGAAVIFLILSIVFMRNQVRSIITLTDAAENFGLGKEVDNFKPSGAMEIRSASQAFLKMKERINRQVSQRTEMLAGVSHDLRTPLTRIKLQLSMMSPDPEIKELQEDITEMEKMIQGYLDFAGGKERVIDSNVNLADLLRSIVSGYRNFHKNIELKTETGIILHVNSNSLRRAITNIIDNAIKYGENITITSSKSKKNIILMIDDDGPGIPASKRNDVFKPFFRIDNSRHIQNGSTGLGLSIAKDIIVSYSGDIIIEDSPKGGVRVVIKIPL